MHDWNMVMIEDLLAGRWPGEWGSDPKPGAKGVSVYRSTELDDNGHVRKSDVYRSIPNSKLSAKRLLTGDILLEASGGTPGRPVGRVGLYNPKYSEVAICSNFLRTLRPKADVCSPYLRWVLMMLHRRPEIWRFQQQTTGMSNLHVRDYLRHKIAVAPLPQQQRIAEILSTVDEAIEQTEALIAKTQQIKAGLMQDLFTRGVTPDGQLRPLREIAPQLYKESPLGWIPKEWDNGFLAERRVEGRPHLKTGPFGSSLKLEHWVEEGVPVITIGALGEGEFTEAELLHISEATAERLRDYQLEVGDVVFSRVADVGRSAVIRTAQRGWVMSSNLMRISLDRKQVIPSFLQAQLAYDSRVRKQIRSTVNSGGRDVANSEILNRLRFSWPPMPEQERINERIDALDARRHCEFEWLAKLSQLKRGLMRDLLTGHVRVPLPADPQPPKVAAHG